MKLPKLHTLNSGVFTKRYSYNPELSAQKLFPTFTGGLPLLYSLGFWKMGESVSAAAHEMAFVWTMHANTQFFQDYSDR